MTRRTIIAAGLLGATAMACAVAPEDAVAGAGQEVNESAGLSKINHFVIIYLENHSFDSMYGQFAGAEGIAKASKASTAQVDLDGKTYETLPVSEELEEAHFAPLPNSTFPLTSELKCTGKTPATLDCPAGSTFLKLGKQKLPDLTHNFFAEQVAINGGKMNKFAAVNHESGGLSMGFYGTKDALPVVEEAKNWTVCDHFFHAAFGGSFINHQWLIAARGPELKGTLVEGMETKVVRGKDGKPKLDASGHLTIDGPVQEEGSVVNMGTEDEPQYMLTATVFQPFAPNPPASSKFSKGLPPSSFITKESLQTHATIGDRLSEKELDWAWYSGGFIDATDKYNDEEYEKAEKAGTLGPMTMEIAESTFQFHHQPFLYFEKYADPESDGRKHMKDEDDFIEAAKKGKLPAVSFVKPIGSNNEHSGYADMLVGEQHVMELIHAIQDGPNWKDTAIIITYDEYGGFWDHVAPPAIDTWGPGARVPTVVISPFAKRGYVDKTIYDTTSILATIEKRWGLAPLTDRDKKAKDLSAAFDFTSPPKE